MKKALVTGISGQDGSYLAELLLEKGYQVFGMIRRTSNNPLVKIQHLIDNPNLKILYGNLRDSDSLKKVLAESQPDEIYNLAAQSDVGVSFKCADETAEINYYGLMRLVDLAYEQNPQVRIYQASTSEMFGNIKPPQNEKSGFAPVSPYGLAKLRAHNNVVEFFREKYGMYICSGILFNHESPRRGEHFVTRKITISMSRIKAGLQKNFELGNLNAIRDWGYSKDYVEMMWLMLQQDKPEDYVISTGEAHTVRDFIIATASELGMFIEFRGEGLEEKVMDRFNNVIISINKDYYRPNEVNYLLGDSTKAKEKLGWIPKTKFKDLVRIMAKADYEKALKEL
jgi:GDPmannose 4,6-dehydratase